MSMQIQTPVSCKYVEGIVQRIDRQSRTLHLTTSTLPMQLIIAPSCEVRLRGEPVTLHLLQSQDRIGVKYVETLPEATAQAIESD